MKIILASASPRRRELLGQIGLDFEVRVSNVEEQVADLEPGCMVEELSRQKAEAALGSLEDMGEDVLVIGADTVVAMDGRILGKPFDSGDAARMLRGLSGGTHEVYTGVTLLYRSCGKGAGEKAFAGMCAGTGEGAVAGIAAGAGEKVFAGMCAGTGKGVVAGIAAGAGEKVFAGMCAGTGKGVVAGVAAGAGEKVFAKEEEKAGRVQRKVFHERTKVTFYPMTEEEIAYYVSSGDCMDKAGAYGIQGFFARYVKGIEGDYNNVVGLPVGRLYQEAREWLER